MRAEPDAQGDTRSIDLCIEGLEQAGVERAELDLTDRAAPLHLVRWETATPELRAVIERYGRAIEGNDEPIEVAAQRSAFEIPGPDAKSLESVFIGSTRRDDSGSRTKPWAE